MSITVEWFDIHQTIIIAQIGYGWGWSTAHQARLTIGRLAQSVSYPVSLIVVLPHDISVPPNGFAENSKDALERHALIGLHCVIYVTSNPSTQALWQLAIDTYASVAVHYRFAATLQAAVALLPC